VDKVMFYKENGKLFPINKC